MSADHSTNRARTLEYGRNSDEKQDTSLENQRDWAARAARQYNLDVLRRFEDPDIPGDEIELRQGLQALLAYAEDLYRKGQPAEVLLNYDGDRFSRANSIPTGYLLYRLTKAGVTKMITAEGVIDFENETDRIVYNLKQDAARASYSPLMSGRVAEGMRLTAREGKWCGGNVPYAYVIGNDGRLALGDPAEVETVGWMFQTYDLTETSIRRMVEELTRRGAPPPRPSSKRRKPRWTKSNVWGILTNPLYTGDFHYGRRTQGKFHAVTKSGAAKRKAVKTKKGYVKRTVHPDGAEIIKRDNHPALVTRERFDRVQAKLEHNNSMGPANRGKKRRNLDWPLSGKACCGDCGAPMWGLTVPVGRNKRAEVRKYSCSTYHEHGRGACHFNAAKEAEILPLVAQAIRWRFSDPETREAIRQRWQQDRQQRQSDGPERLASLRRRIARLVELQQGGREKLALCGSKIAADMVRDLEQWKAEQEALEQEVGKLEHAAAVVEEDDRLIAEVLEAFDKLGELVNDVADEAELTRAIAAYVERVELHFTQVELAERRLSHFAKVTVHFRPLGAILEPLSVSLATSAPASRCTSTSA
jgi:DNA invertase Pin-like site-specific DNA recombinase